METGTFPNMRIYFYRLCGGYKEVLNEIFKGENTKQNSENTFERSIKKEILNISPNIIMKIKKNKNISNYKHTIFI